MFVIADGGNITAVGNLGLTGVTTLTGSLSVSTTTALTGEVTTDISVNKNKKVKQMGACLQSSTHQAIAFGI